MKNNHVVEFSVNEARREFHLEAQDDTFDMEKEEYGGRELGARKEQESDVPDGSGGKTQIQRTEFIHCRETDRQTERDADIYVYRLTNRDRGRQTYRKTA